MDTTTLADLINGSLPWRQLKEILSGTMSADRFDLYRQVMRSRAGFDEIPLPLAEYLYVASAHGRIVKCDCGHQVGPVAENWKRASRILVPEREELLEEIYGPCHRCDPRWMELREYYCPGCWSLLEVEAVPPGYPVESGFEPGINTFYSDFPGRPAPGVR